MEKSFTQFINEQLNDRLKSALGGDSSTKVPLNKGDKTNQEETTNDTSSKIVTTADEIESFFIIKTLLHGDIADHTLNYKDTETYFGILLDNNTRKWICRLQLGEKRKNLIIPDVDKNYIKHQIDTLDDLYNYKDELCQVAKQYMEEV